MVNEELEARALKEIVNAERALRTGMVQEEGALRKAEYPGTAMAGNLVEYRALLEKLNDLVGVGEEWVLESLRHENAHMTEAIRTHGDNLVRTSYGFRFLDQHNTEPFIFYELREGIRETPEQRARIVSAVEDPSEGDKKMLREVEEGKLRYGPRKT